MYEATPNEWDYSLPRTNDHTLLTIGFREVCKGISPVVQGFPL